ncbi:hypothetical protein BJ912DRAFT_973020 [Pholiota molesta]|nr:hypothetical protein BJ912DRAFT_973020 [Pholiota molesta]
MLKRGKSNSLRSHMASDICLVCRGAPKRPDHQFCSRNCTQAAASKAPELLRVPKGHVLHDNVTKLWADKWHDSTHPCPPIAKIYLITWTADMRASFDNYRDEVARKRNTPADKPKEIKCFRSERRACHLGDSEFSKSLCTNPSCRLCAVIKTGFRVSLESQRQQVARGANNGVPFGGGIYMNAGPNEALEYAKDHGNGSEYHAVLVTRTVLGNMQTLSVEDHGRMSPDRGYDAVQRRADGGGSLEYVVYDENAVRPAYLIMVRAR